MKQLCIQREKLVSPFALEKAAQYGVDPRYTTLSQVYYNNIYPILLTHL